MAGNNLEEVGNSLVVGHIQLEGDPVEDILGMHSDLVRSIVGAVGKQGVAGKQVAVGKREVADKVEL